MEATGTNTPINTNTKHVMVGATPRNTPRVLLASTVQSLTQHTNHPVGLASNNNCIATLRFVVAGMPFFKGVSVVDSGGETPGPIPNPEAKPARADGTAPGREWESRLPPTQQLHTYAPAHTMWAGAFSFACNRNRVTPQATGNGLRVRRR